MSIKTILNGLLGGSDGKGFLTELADNIDRFVDTPEDKKEFLKMAIEDRSDARSMYKSDSSLQKIFAIFFLIVWAALLGFNLYYFFTQEIQLSEWQIAFINTIWGGISAKLNTIVDFLFGSSTTTQQSEKKKK